MEMPIFTVKLYGSLSIPFSRKKSFNRFPSVILYLALQESQPLIAQLQAGRPSRALYRKLGQYAVQIYPSHLQALLDAGAAELLDGASYRLADPSLYDRNTGLSLEVDTGNALLI